MGKNLPAKLARDRGVPFPVREIFSTVFPFAQYATHKGLILNNTPKEKRNKIMQMKMMQTQKNWMITFCAALTFFALGGLTRASDVRLTADASVPAAAGKAHLSKDKNGNLKLKVEVFHLAKPGALSPGKQTYVVWTQARDKAPENRGELMVNDKLQGHFEETVRNEDFEVFVTAEDNPKVDIPSEPKLMKGNLQP
jgi:hypothetical protein